MKQRQRAIPIIPRLKPFDSHRHTRAASEKEGLTAPLGLLLPAISPLADPVHHRLVEEDVHCREQHLATAPESLKGRHHVSSNAGLGG